MQRQKRKLNNLKEGWRIYEQLKKNLVTDIVVSMLILLCVMITPAMAASGSDYLDAANKLHDLGLYNGISNQVFQPDLDGMLDRQTGAVMLLRMFGLEKEALSMDLADTKATLQAKFKDASSIPDWAAKQVAYAVEGGIIGGFPDSTFRPEEPLTGRQYSTLTLKLLGYNVPDFSKAGEQYATVACLSEQDVAAFGVDGAINKGILIGISYSALFAKGNGKLTTLAEDLVKTGVIDAQKARDAGVTLLISA